MGKLLFGATASEQPRVTAAFKEWMDGNGIDDRKCRIYCFESTGRGAKAASRIKQGDVVSQVSFAAAAWMRCP
jgi:hypothetical protein